MSNGCPLIDEVRRPELKIRNWNNHNGSIHNITAPPNSISEESLVFWNGNNDIGSNRRGGGGTGIGEMLLKGTKASQVGKSRILGDLSIVANLCVDLLSLNMSNYNSLLRSVIKGKGMTIRMTFLPKDRLRRVPYSAGSPSMCPQFQLALSAKLH